jgi:hypothetical protein
VIEKYPMGMPDHLMSNRRLPLSACSAVGHQLPQCVKGILKLLKLLKYILIEY